MITLDGLKATGNQKFRTLASNGDFIEITLYFLSAIQQWSMDIKWNNFILNGFKVFNSLNILSQYENIIPFGIAIIIPDGGEPFIINDFSTKRVQLGILSPEEIEEINAFYVEQKA